MAREAYDPYEKARAFDITKLQASGGYAGLFLLSEATWEFAYNLILFYGYWRSRYYYSNPTTGELETITDEEYLEVQDLVDLALEELRCYVSCPDLIGVLQQIAQSINVQSSCCTETGIGQDIPNDNGEGDPPVLGVGEQAIEYSNPSPLVDRDCLIANFIYDKFEYLLLEMQRLKVDEYGALGLVAVATVIGAILGSVTVIGTLVGAVAGVVIGLAAALIAGGIDMDNIVLEWQANHEAIVCAIYEAVDTDTLEAAIISLLTGLTTAEVGLMQLLLTNSTLALRFRDVPGLVSELTGYTPTIDCGTACAEPQQCVLVALEDGVMTEGYDMTLVNGAVYDPGGWIYLPTGSAQIRIDFDLSAFPIVVDTLYNWSVYARIYLTVGPNYGGVTGSIGCCTVGGSDWNVGVWSWPQPSGVWGDDTEIKSRAFHTKSPTARLVITNPDGNCRVSHYSISIVPGQIPECSAPPPP